MIYTITCNPSLDYVVKLPELKLGEINRTGETTIFPGGKGINVSLVLKELEVPSVAMGFIGGFTGDAIEKLLQQADIETAFGRVGGDSRINVKLNHGEETEINGMGPFISQPEVEVMLSTVQALSEEDIVVVAGSLPDSVPQNLYSEIARRAKERKVRVVVDAAGQVLKDAVGLHPFLVKPNQKELGALYGVELKTKEDVTTYAKRLQQEGAQNVLVSLAKDGAVLVTENAEVYWADAPKGTVVNSVGAGDSMVAGFLAAYEEGKSWEEILIRAVSVGSASAFLKGLATKGFAEELEAEVIVTKVS